ncbi:hypothetical protein FBZ33_5013 [Micromonospora sp. A202]|nr:hypothetical protein FBZ33_5013 [Micromonospora sp. A202]
MTFEEYAFARTSALIRLARLLTDDEHRAEDLVQKDGLLVLGGYRPAHDLDRPDTWDTTAAVECHPNRLAGGRSRPSLAWE